MKAKSILFCAGLIAALLASLCKVCTALAEDTAALLTPQTYQEHPSREASYETAPDSDSFEDWPAGPLVYADSAVVMDMDSGAVLYSKNADKPQFPASITKFMTALVALENSKPDDKVEITQDCVSFLEWGDASIGMMPGEVICMKDAIHAMLMASANEVSYAIAESVGKNRLGGGYGTFIEKMNTRAAQLGCTHSHWVNTNGLHDDKHYTSARDMALIASALYRQPMFHTVMGCLQYTIPPTNLVSESRTFQQNHKMMWEGGEYYYEYCKGGKTGFTDQSGTTLVTVADNGLRRLAAVVLHSYAPEAYYDTRAMFDYGFDMFQVIPVTENETSDLIGSFKDRKARVTVPFGVKFSEIDKKITLLSRGTDRAQVSYTYKGNCVGAFEATLTEKGCKELNGLEFAAPQKTSADVKAPRDKAGKKDLSLKIFFGTIAACAALFTAGVGLIFHHIKTAGRRRARHRRTAQSESDMRQI